MTEEYCEEQDFKMDSDTLSSLDIRRMEFQANYFASCLLLPRSTFVSTFYAAARQYGVQDRGFGKLYVDEQDCNQQSYYLVTSQLSSMYKVSRKVVEMRLKNLELMVDVRPVLK